MSTTIHIDLETRSRCDLKKSGAFRYANDPSTEILCLSIAEENNEPLIWVPLSEQWRPDWSEDVEAIKLMEKLSGPDTIIYAHNAMFEIACLDAMWKKTTGFDPPAHRQWRCTAAMGRRAALPASLEKLAEVLKLKHLKDARGKSLIRKFSIPQKDGHFIQPEDDIEAFRQFCEYCRQDVKVEQEIHQTLKDFDLTGFPLQTFLLDIEINARGFPVNLDALRKAEKLVNEETERLSVEFRRLTGLNPTQGVKLLAWLKEQGFKGKDLRAETLEEFFEIFDDELDETSLLGKVLLLKKRISFASLKKIPAMINCAGPHDNRVRGTLTYHGAGTGRWSASLVQPQNFKRPAAYMESLSPQAYRDICEGCTNEWLDLVYGPPLEVISSCIRHFIQDDRKMLSADYSAIEARLLAWQAQETWKLEVFKGHGKIYEAAACQMFGVTMEDFDTYKKLHGKNHPLRQKAKSGELACGYAGGPNALVRMGALKQGLTEEELPGLIKAWREANPNIVSMWNDIDNAVKNAIRSTGKAFPFGVGCSFFCTHTAGMKFLFMKLPSGRKLAYPQPELVPQLMWQETKLVSTEETDKETGEVRQVVKEVGGDYKKILNPTTKQIAQVKEKYPKARMGEAITFFGQIPLKQTWGRIATHKGVFCNNQIQGIAGDFMANGLINCEARGYETYSIIHDEDLSAYSPELGQTAEEFTQLLTKLPAWGEGMPLAAEGGVVEFYQK